MSRWRARILFVVACGAGCHPPARTARAPAATARVAPEVIVQGWPKESVRALAWEGAELVASLESQTVVFDVATGMLASRRPAQQVTPVIPPDKRACTRERVTAIATSPDGRFLGCAEQGGVVAIVERETKRRWRWHPNPYLSAGTTFALAFHPSRPVLAAATSEGLVVHDWAAQESVRASASTTDAVAFSADGALLASGGRRGDVDVWETGVWQRIRALRSRTLPAIAVAADPREPRLYVAAGALLLGQATFDGAFEVTWDARDGGTERRGIERAPVAASFDPRADVLVRATSEDLVATTARAERWRTTTKGARFTHVAHAGDLVVALGASAGAYETHALRAFDAASGAPRWSTAAERGAPASLAVSADGSLLAAGVTIDGQGRVDVLATATGERVTSWVTTAAPSVAFVGDGLVASAGVVVEARSGRVTKTLGDLAAPLQLATSPDGRTLAVAGGRGELTVFDTTTWNRLSLRVDDGAAASIAFLGGSSHVVWKGAGGTLKAIDLQTDRVSTFALMERGAVVVVGPHGEYLAPRDAAGAVAFRWDARVYPFDQFDAIYNNPTRALEGLGFLAPDARSLFDAARARRMDQLGLRGGVASAGALPTVRLASVPPSSHEKRLVLHVRGADPAGRLRRIHVADNGVPVFGDRGKEVTPARNVDEDVTIELVPGPNKIAVAVENEDGVPSLEATTVVTYVGPAPEPAVHVFAVGVTRYRDRSLDLTYPAKDARDVLAAFCGGDRCAHAVELTDAAATRDGILALRTEIERTKPEDAVVVYLSGHGALDARGGYLFAPHDVDPSALERTGVPYAALEGLLDAVPARRKLLVMDTCNAGELDPEQVRAIAHAGKVKVVQAAALATVSPRARAARDLFAELRRGTGTHVLASSSGVEYSLEDPRYQNSVFTHALLRGLREREADEGRTGAITVSALRAFVTKTVAELTAGHQTPSARRENLDADFDLVMGGPSAAGRAATCALDRADASYRCGLLRLKLFPNADGGLARARDAIARSLPDGRGEIVWRQAGDRARWEVVAPYVEDPIDGGVAGLVPDEHGAARLAVCRVEGAIPEVLARCERAMDALARRSLPDVLPP
ncbi:MAG: caspase family protein [Labilithrix sp.]|nr:caspase family protein [Labilithrix sp.]MCW5817045.1 caspase family protein [Labilithrix sp.]